MPSVVTLALAGSFTVDSLAVQTFSDWSEPVNLGPLINSEFNDSYAAVSQKGLSL